MQESLQPSMEYDINEDDFAYKEYIKYGEKK